MVAGGYVAFLGLVLVYFSFFLLPVTFSLPSTCNTPFALILPVTLLFLPTPLPPLSPSYPHNSTSPFTPPPALHLTSPQPPRALHFSLPSPTHNPPPFLYLPFLSHQPSHIYPFTPSPTPHNPAYSHTMSTYDGSGGGGGDPLRLCIWSPGVPESRVLPCRGSLVGRHTCVPPPPLRYVLTRCALDMCRLPYAASCQPMSD